MRQRARADNLTVRYRKNQMGVSFSCVCPVSIDCPVEDFNGYQKNDEILNGKWDLRYASLATREIVGNLTD